MRREALTLLLGAAAALAAIGVCAWAGPAPALVVPLVLIVPLAVVVLRPRRRHGKRGNATTNEDASGATGSAPEAQVNRSSLMTPTAPENPSDAPSTPKDATGASASDRPGHSDPTPEVEQAPEDDYARLLDELLDADDSDADKQSGEDRPLRETPREDDLDALDELLSETAHGEDEQASGSNPSADVPDTCLDQTPQDDAPDALDEARSHDEHRQEQQDKDERADRAVEDAASRLLTEVLARFASIVQDEPGEDSLSNEAYVSDEDLLDELLDGYIESGQEEPLEGDAQVDALAKRELRHAFGELRELIGSIRDRSAKGAELGQQSPTFSWDDVEARLLMSPRPLRELDREVKRIRKNEDAVTPAELFFAQRVEDSGILDKDMAKKAKFVSLTSLMRSDLLYIRGLNRRLDYDCRLSLISLEATLNLMRRANEHYDGLSLVSEADLCSLEHRLMGRVLFEAPLVDTANWTYLAMPWQFPSGPAEHGEWSCRHQLAEAIEGLRLPWRLKARFHANVSEGTLAIEFDATPPDALPRHTYVADLGLQATTVAWRAREASAYAARVGLLLASLGFASSRRIRYVFVKATHDAAERHLCLFSAKLDRRAFSHLRLQSLTDPVATLRALGASIDAEDGVLSPVPERFHLGDAAFCPSRRHDIMTLTDHALPASAAHALGARRLLDLSIHEELGRVIAADDILRLSCDTAGDTSAEERVRAIMDVAASTSDLTVWDAATRVVRQIVEGRLSCDDVWALRDELVEGDDLSRALSRSKELFMAGDASTASRLIEEALAPLDRQGVYRDSDSIAYRSFDNFTERVLYNRMSADDTRAIALVPDAYLIAHISLASIFLVEGQEDRSQLDRALRHVRRALDVAPLNTPATMLLSSVLEAAGDTDGAQEVLSSYLRHAFNPQGIGYAYLKLAEAAAEEHDERRAFSCYQMCMHTMPAFAPVVFAQAQALSEQGLTFPDNMTMVDVQECLEAAGIPLAPTQHTFFDLFDGAIAATDAEVFPVARDIMSFIEALTGDDVMHAVRESLEREPDA